VLDEPVSWTVFGERILRHRGTKLRALLLDRTVLAGIGPVYADEILHASGLRPDRDISSLSTQEIRRFFRAVVETLHEAAKHRGVTTSDDQYHDLAGKPGGWTAELQVYERDGKACQRCRGRGLQGSPGQQAGLPVRGLPGLRVWGRPGGGHRR
jgi:formamidopyrimidine-DNA glycosylase